jgi:hypothetical protein
METLLNSFSGIISFLFAVGSTYLVLDYTVGRLKFLKSNFEWHGLQIKDFVFIALAFCLMLFFFHPYKPYK